MSPQYDQPSQADRRPGIEEERETYAGLAVAALREAVAAGFKDLDRLQTDPDFDPIAQHPRFKDLIEQLQNN